MQIYWNKGKSLRKKRVEFPLTGLVQQHVRPFSLEHQYDGCDEVKYIKGSQVSKTHSPGGPDRPECFLYFNLLYVYNSLKCHTSPPSLRKQTFLLAHRRWGTFSEEERLRLSDRNSILMT